MKNSTVLGLLWFMLCMSVNAQETVDSTRANLYTENIPSRFFSDIYLHNTLEHFIENLYDLAYNQIETTGDYSRVDPYRFSFTGYSYQWNRYYFRNHRFNDLFNPGASLYKPLLTNTDLEMNIINSSVRFSPVDNFQDHFKVQFNTGHFGGRIPGADEILKFILGHESAFKSTYIPIDRRKRTRANGSFLFQTHFISKSGALPFTFLADFGERRVTGFNFGGLNKEWKEGHLKLYTQGDLPIKAGKLFDRTSYLAEFLSRENLNSEYYYDVSETAEFTQINVSLWGEKISKNQSSTGINFSSKEIKKNFPGFSRNFVDQDGEGLEPWYPSAKINEFSLAHRHTIPLKDHRFDINIELFNGLLIHDPTEKQFSNSVYYEDVFTTYTPLYITEWESNKFTTGLLENTVGIKYSPDPVRKFRWQGDFDLTFDGILLDKKSITKPNYQFDLQGEFRLHKRHVLKAQVGRRRIPFHFDQVRFISNDYLSGQQFFWRDLNNDRDYQSNEQLGLFKTTGGKYHHLSGNLRQPSINYFDLSWEWNIGKKWFFYVINQYRSFRNLWTSEFEKNLANLGTIVLSAGEEVFMFNGGEVVNYNVVPFKEELMEQAAETKLNFIFDNPFYAGSTMKLSKETKRSYFVTSFSAYMVTGFAPMGNGVLHNTPGILSESLANPNTYIDYLGRFDSDRAFIIRMLWGYKFNFPLRMAFQMLWKDGQPINLFEKAISRDFLGNQVAFWNENIKGINPFTGQFGSRESAYFNFEFRFKYEASLKDHPLNFNLNIYNIFDFGTTLSNFSFSPGPSPAHRFVLDVQLPRGVIIGVDYSF